MVETLPSLGEVIGLTPVGKKKKSSYFLGPPDRVLAWPSGRWICASHNSLGWGVCVRTRTELCRIYSLWACGQVWPGVCLWVSAPGVCIQVGQHARQVCMFEAGHACVGVPAILVSSGPRSL